MENQPYIGPITTLPQLAEQLMAHEARSQKRYEDLKECIQEHIDYEEGKEKYRMEGLASDKVNINVGDGGGGGGAGGLAAVIAALGNRNQGNDNAALIAALGNRNDDSGNWIGPLMAMANNRGPGYGYGDGFGMGGGGIWPIILLALLGRRGGFGGGDGDCCDNGHGGVNPAQAAILQTLMEGQSDLRAQVPTVGLETQNAILSALARDALGTQQGFANTKDAIQTGNAFLDRDIQMVNQNVSAQGCQTREWVSLEAEKTRAKVDKVEDRINAIQENNLQRELAVCQSALSDEKHHSRIREVEVNVSQNVNQQQAQAQAQLQMNDLVRHFGLLSERINIIGNQVARNSQDVVNVGGLLAGVAQTANPVNVK